jgi:transcription initiation factor TFIIIB Brf1 subunit/transcription initiation factor TFIIB|mmetsp:Transcript_5680/g.7614  ORF Transcript_5680/g.7614 Transcript_5680/m.7614 type:complete len:84 (+) Transcript_5680:2378-2629(+)
MLAYKPSELAASSLYLASKLCFSKEPWSNRMASITTLQEKTLRKCSKDIYTEVLLKNINESNKLRAVFNKFSTSKYGSVSTKI